MIHIYTKGEKNWGSCRKSLPEIMFLPDNRTSMVRPCIINRRLYSSNIFIESKCRWPSIVILSESFYVCIYSLSNNIWRFMVKGRNWVLGCRFTLLNKHIFSLTNRPLKRCIYAYDNEVWHFSIGKIKWSELMVCCTGRGRLTKKCLFYVVNINRFYLF